MKVSVFGAGYVGLSLAILISQKYEVVLIDIDEDKVNKIKNNESPFKDENITEFLLKKNLKLTATNNPQIAYENSNFIIIATPTNYDLDKGMFDTSTVEKVIGEALNYNNKSTIIIKSTIPLGFTDRMRNQFKTNRIIFSL